jgi:glycosyltransferase involved in cell wall biosynthesis
VVTIIPALNEAATVGHVVRVAKRVSQTVVVVDNASDDATAKVAISAGAHVISCPTIGKSEAVRTALTWLESQPSPDVVMLLDADLSEQLETTHVRCLLSALASSPAVDMACGVLWRSRLHRFVMVPLPVATFTGQRAIRYNALKAIDLSNCRGYRLEAVLSAAVSGRRTLRTPWIEVSHTRRERRVNAAWARPTGLPKQLAGPWMRLTVLTAYLRALSSLRPRQPHLAASEDLGPAGSAKRRRPAERAPVSTRTS